MPWRSRRANAAHFDSDAGLSGDNERFWTPATPPACVARYGNIVPVINGEQYCGSFWRDGRAMTITALPLAAADTPQAGAREYCCYYNDQKGFAYTALPGNHGARTFGTKMFTALMVACFSDAVRNGMAGLGTGGMVPLRRPRGGLHHWVSTPSYLPRATTVTLW